MSILARIMMKMKGGKGHHSPIVILASSFEDFVKYFMDINDVMKEK